MASFIAVYRGHSIRTAHLVAVTTSPRLVAAVATELLGGGDEGQFDTEDDPAIDALKKGRRRALELVQAEADGEVR